MIRSVLLRRLTFAASLVLASSLVLVGCDSDDTEGTTADVTVMTETTMGVSGNAFFSAGSRVAAAMTSPTDTAWIQIDGAFGAGSAISPKRSRRLVP